MSNFCSSVVWSLFGNTIFPLSAGGTSTFETRVGFYAAQLWVSFLLIYCEKTAMYSKCSSAAAEKHEMTRWVRILSVFLSAVPRNTCRTCFVALCCCWLNLCIDTVIIDVFSRIKLFTEFLRNKIRMLSAIFLPLLSNTMSYSYLVSCPQKIKIN